MMAIAAITGTERQTLGRSEIRHDCIQQPEGYQQPKILYVFLLNAYT